MKVWDMQPVLAELEIVAANTSPTKTVTDTTTTPALKSAATSDRVLPLLCNISVPAAKDQKCKFQACRYLKQI